MCSYRDASEECTDNHICKLFVTTHRAVIQDMLAIHSEKL